MCVPSGASDRSIGGGVQTLCQMEMRLMRSDCEELSVRLGLCISVYADLFRAEQLIEGDRTSSIKSMDRWS